MLITVEKFMISNARIFVGFGRVTVVAESVFFFSHARQSVRMYQRGPH
jgi:hypothetical protein